MFAIYVMNHLQDRPWDVRYVKDLDFCLCTFFVIIETITQFSSFD